MSWHVYKFPIIVQASKAISLLVFGLNLDSFLFLFEVGLDSITASPGLGHDSGGLDYSPTQKWMSSLMSLVPLNGSSSYFLR